MSESSTENRGAAMPPDVADVAYLRKMIVCSQFGWPPGGAELGDALRRFDALSAQLREARDDADRYRWLREPRTDLSFMFDLSKDGRPLGVLALELLDAAIDSRRALASTGQET